MSSSHSGTLSPAVHHHEGVGFAPRAGLVPAFGRIALKALEGLATWQERASARAHLAALDDYYLKDMGLDRAQVEREATKPFWRA